MHINFLQLASEAGFQPARRLTVPQFEAERDALLRDLIHNDVDLGLVQMVHHLLDDAMESGYHGGYNDAHWYARGVGDGA